MNTKHIKTVIGILSYNDRHYLEKTLPLIYGIENSQIVILDNAQNDEVKKFVNHKFPEIQFIRHKDGNTGFGKGHNYIVEKAPDSDYYFCLNNDILIEEPAFKACIEYMEQHKQADLVSAKLYYWDYENDKRTNIIDTVGIVGSIGHHFWDRGQGKQDTGQYDNSINNIFGISGAAFFIRRSSIKKIHGTNHTIFDENFFMYKEDIDLSYRMRWLGMGITLLPEVLGYHARTLGKGKTKSEFEQRMSYQNHILMLKNNFSRGYSLKTKIATFTYECLKFLYYLLRKPKIAMLRFQGMKDKINKSRKKISAKKMESYLLK